MLLERVETEHSTPPVDHHWGLLVDTTSAHASGKDFDGSCQINVRSTINGQVRLHHPSNIDKCPHDRSRFIRRYQNSRPGSNMIFRRHPFSTCWENLPVNDLRPTVGGYVSSTERLGVAIAVDHRSNQGDLATTNDDVGHRDAVGIKVR